MAVTYEEALDYIRKGSLMLDEALSRNDSQSRAKIRVAFYQLYQAANLSIMIAPPFVMEEAVKSDDYTSFVDAREVFDLWAKRVKGFVDRVAAQSKLDIMKTKGYTREEGLGGCPEA